MRKQPIIPGYEIYQKNIEDEFEKVLEITKQNTLPDWTIQDLDRVLMKLKMRQSHDAQGWANEIFALKNIGSNLKESILHICNQIKKHWKYQISFTTFLYRPFLRRNQVH